MNVLGLDERNFIWEADDPVFVVILHDDGGASGHSFATDTKVLTDCGVLDAIRWAQENVEPRGRWLLGLVDQKPVREGGEELGFTYLEGYDPNVGDPLTCTPWQQRQLREMERRGARKVLAD